MSFSITYQQENELSVDEFVSVLQRSTLGQRRPVEDTVRLADMLSNADLIVTARHNGLLIGVSRAISDFAFCTYLSDLAVDEKYQKKASERSSFGRLSWRRRGAKLILLSAPKAVDYYPKIGMKHHAHCYYIDTAEELK